MSREERFEQLWTDWLEGELDAAGEAELRSLLETNEALLRRAATLYQTHRLIGLTLQVERQGAFVEATMAKLPAERESFLSRLMERLPGRPRPAAAGWVGWRYAAVALSAMCLMFAVQRFWGRAPVAGNNPRPQESVATLLVAEDCRWRNAKEVPQEGQRLAPGWLDLARGLAVLRFDSGALAILTRDAHVEIESRGKVRLRRGELTVRASEEAAGFTVQTPAGEMVDLGTEFAVRVEPSGGTELHVLEGAVERRTPEQPPRPGVTVSAGRAMRYEHGSARAVPLAAKRFAELLRQTPGTAEEHMPLVYEGFNYPRGERPVAKLGGDFGWAGPWRLREGIERRENEPRELPVMLIVDRDFEAPWLPPTRGGMYEALPGENYRLRPMSEPIVLGSNAIYYISLMTRAEAVRPGAAMGQARLTFRSSTEYWGNSVSLGTDSLRTQIRFGNGVNFTGPVPGARGNVQLWVAKIAARRDGEDEIAFKIYDAAESADAAEPAQWTVVSRGLRSDARLDLAVLTAIGDGKRWFDELRIGRTWRSVVPIAPPLSTLAGESAHSD